MKTENNDLTIDNIRKLNQKYKDTYGKDVDYTIIPKGLSQERLVKCLELMIDDNISLLVAYNKLYNN